MASSLVGGLSGVIFDAYGTLFDVTALDAACAAVTESPVELSRLWRAKQLEYAFLRTAIDRYADFSQITSDALDYALGVFGLEAAPSERRELMRAWLTLPPFPEVPRALRRLHDSGNRLAILSNGTRQMLLPLIDHAGLGHLFIDVLSSEQVQAFKPDASIYSLAPERFHAGSYELLFVTANGFDVAGSKAFGFTVCRVNRGGLPLDPLGFEPDLTVQNLMELADELTREV